MFERTILCASDGLAHSERALRRAGEIARERGAQLHVVYIAEPRPGHTGRGDGHAMEVATLWGVREQRLRTQLQRLAATEPTVTVVPHFLRGARTEARGDEETAARRISRLADQIDAELIVVGSRAPGERDPAGVDGTSRRLMRRTRRPVLALVGSHMSADPGAERTEAALSVLPRRLRRPVRCA